MHIMTKRQKKFVRMFLKICLENITVQIVETATKTCLKIKLKFNNPSVRAVIFQGWVKKSQVSNTYISLALSQNLTRLEINAVEMQFYYYAFEVYNNLI